MISTAFEDYLAEALRDLPEEFQAKMENVEVIVEELADPETLDHLGIDSGWDLLGLYQGVPISQRSVFFGSVMPDIIVLYRKPILWHAKKPEHVSAVVRSVLLHEIGHHFGFNEDQLAELERRSR
jgi:predicted Zn-dependent protease with MMP-like domain